MKALIDTCVILDVFTNREPFKDDSLRVLRYVAAGKIAGYVTSCSLKDIYYLIRKYNHSSEKTFEVLRSIVTIFNVLDVSKEDAINAIESGNNDFEDALIIESTKRNGISTIITRNSIDFKNTPLQIISPSQVK